jgi:hypothetical protein
MTHISYEVAKKLKAFLGDSAPEPMVHEYWVWWSTNPSITDDYTFAKEHDGIPAYQLHDLLSKPFCEAFTKEYHKTKDIGGTLPHALAQVIYTNYYEHGMEAVEKGLMRMMEAK